MSTREHSGPPAQASKESQGSHWTFLSNHAHVLVCLSQDGDLRIRDLAARVGITERAVQKILGQLEAEGIVTRQREGRRNHYEVHLDQPLRHPVERHCSVRELVELIQQTQQGNGADRG